MRGIDWTSISTQYSVMELYCTKIVGSPILESLIFPAQSRLAGKNVLRLRKVRLQENNRNYKGLQATKLNGRRKVLMVKICQKYSKIHPCLVQVDLMGFNGTLHLFHSIIFNLPVTPPTVCLLVLLRRWCSLWCSPGHCGGGSAVCGA